VKRPAGQKNVKALMDEGLQVKPDVEVRLPYYTGKLDPVP
jgi:hypothetical protein